MKYFKHKVRHNVQFVKQDELQILIYFIYNFL